MESVRRRRKCLDLRLVARAARGAIGGDYKRTTMRMAQLYGPLKARRCITPLRRHSARCERERVPTLRGSFLSRPPREGAINIAVYLISRTWASLDFTHRFSGGIVQPRNAGNYLSHAYCMHSQGLGIFCLNFSRLS